MKDNPYLRFLTSLEAVINEAQEQSQKCSVGLFESSFDRPQNERVALQKKAMTWSRLTHALSLVSLAIVEVQLDSGITLSGIEMSTSKATRANEAEEEQ